MIVHLDTDFLIHALSAAGPHRRSLEELSESDSVIQMSAIAWYEFCRGPRSGEQLAVSRDFLGVDGIVSFSESIAQAAAERFRLLGSPRRRAADIAIATTALLCGAQLWTDNKRDFQGIEGLDVKTPASSV